MKYDAVVLDLDGTLIHTKPSYRYLVVGKTLRDLKVPFSREKVNKFWFGARRNEIIREEFGLDPDTFWNVFYSYDTNDLREKYTESYNDVIFVKELRQNGFKTGIVTGAPLRIANLEIGMIGEENFDAIVVAHSLNGFRPKPDPHGLKECLSCLGVENDRAIYVGDADEDIETARNAQIFDVLLYRAEHDHSLIPSLKINSLYDLRGFLGM